MTMPASTTSWCAAAMVIVLAIRFRPTAPARTLLYELQQGLAQDQIATQQSTARRLGRRNRFERLTVPAKRRSADGELARWCDDLARAVRGGATLHASLRTVPTPDTSQIDEVLHDLLQHLARGQSLSDSIRVVTATHAGGSTEADRSADADIALIMTVLEQCATTGGSSAEPLERAASVLRARDAARGEVAAQSASARMSAVVLTLLPIAMLALLLATSESTRGAVATPLGIAITTAGLALNFAGWRWMGRMINGVR